MAQRISDAEWRGDLKDGAGTLRLGSGAFEGRYSFKSRFEDGPGTNPEELIAAAHAACFSMALSAALSQKGHLPTSIHTKATVHFGPVTGGFAISRIELETEGQVPGIDAATFEQVAQAAKAECRLGDIERVEINEAFAAIAIVVTRELGLPEDIVNVEGGAIAHGHPIGATGAVLTTRLIHSMRRDGLRRGLVTLCIGGGQGIALALEIAS